MAQPQPMQQARSKKHTGIIIVVVIVVVVALIGFFMISKNGKIVVTVTSTHLVNDVEYRVFLDGQLKYSGTLSPLGSIQYTFDITWLVDSCQTHQVSADSTGGVLGPQSDSESVELCGGTVEQAALLI
jgi:hypothetical protein